MGDGALVEFSSVVAAVQCALAIQAATEAANAGIRYRIGINIGEVIVEGEDIYGEGVNIATRLQALAAPGGVVVSRIVRDNAEGKIACVFEDLGEHSVKNIDRPLHVFAVRAGGESAESARVGDRRKLSVCVLPFANMSGEAEQEYFSDGISEDIITDLSKVSALGVIARNTAFQFKGKSVDVPRLARQLKVGYVVEGSVRKAGGRVRITAQLIDGRSGEHVWADRYDRDLNDIFALQDEISQAIVGALRLKLLPEEKRAIEQRGTSNPEAYKYFLMARQYRDTGNAGNRRASDLAIRLCRRAVDIDPNYAQAWALLALVQSSTKLYFDSHVEDGLKEAERAIAIDPNLPEAHAAKARALNLAARYPEALIELERALALDPESYEAHREAAIYATAMHDAAGAIRHFEKAASLVEGEYYAAGMVIAFYEAVGDQAGKERAARRALARTEKLLETEPDHGSALSFGITALMALGEVERGKEWIERALLVDPDNVNMRYNLACTLINQAHDIEGGLDLLASFMERAHQEPINWMKVDPDMDRVRDHVRFKDMVAAAEARIAAEAKGGAR
jgi:adenylate cyclase